MGIDKFHRYINKANYFFLLLFVFWLPLKDDFLPLIMFLWIFTWLLEGQYKKRINKLPNKPLLIALFIYFFLTITALFISNSINDGIFEIQKKLSMVIFPVILIGSKEKIAVKQDRILYTFVLGNLIAALYCLSNAAISSIILKNGQICFEYWTYPEFANHSFWELVNNRFNYFSSSFLSVLIHPSYFAMFLVFSISILVSLLNKNKQIKNLYKIGLIFLIFFFMFMIYLLQSRAGLISLVLVIFIFAIIKIQKQLKKRYLFLLIVSLPILGLLVFSSSKLNRNYLEIKKMYTNSTDYSLKSVDIRYQVWYTSTIIIKENLFLGTSPANLSDELVEKYNEFGFKDAASERLNCHNQYLESFAGLGIFGFLALLFILFYSFVLSIKNRNYLLFFFIIILSLNFLFESMLNRMSGILFMMFFLSLLVFAEIPDFERINKNIHEK